MFLFFFGSIVKIPQCACVKLHIQFSTFSRYLRSATQRFVCITNGRCNPWSRSSARFSWLPTLGTLADRCFQRKSNKMSLRETRQDGCPSASRTNWQSSSHSWDTIGLQLQHKHGNGNWTETEWLRVNIWMFVHLNCNKCIYKLLRGAERGQVILLTGL